MKKLLIGLVMVASAAHAEFYSGNELLSRMQSSEQVDRMLAMGYIAGVVDSFNGIIMCAPPTITLGQTLDIVKLSMITKPQNRHYSADSLIVLALKEVWPCPTKPKSSV